jgi:hypothetical protein
MEGNMTSTSFTTVGLWNTFVFPFRQPRAGLKLLIACLILLAGFVIPILPWIIFEGYQFKIMRRIIVEKEDPSLPDWDDWGGFLRDGVRLMGARLIYMLPFVILLWLGIVVYIAFLFSFTSERLPHNNTFSLLFGLAPMLFIGKFVLGSWIFSAFMGVIVPPALCHLVAKDSFGAAFDFRGWWRVFRVNMGGFLLAFVLVMALAMMIGIIGQVLYMTIILCCLLPFVSIFTSAYLALVSMGLYAQVYREGIERIANSV